MDFNEYQKETRRTASHDTTLEVTALGVAGEAGEIADLVKKYLGHGHPLDAAKLIAEGGDVLWYLARLCDYLGVALEDMAKYNVEKLRQRYPDGFTVEASLNRTC